MSQQNQNAANVPPVDPLMSEDRQGMFVVEGRNVLFTFCLVSSLFLIWGLLNGMIDVMDKHFQNELNLTLGQSAWVQFAHWIGYFLMSLPAGWLATRLGYRGGILTGLLMVALGGFWFIPATRIVQFWAFLLGVCVIAAGLAFLETVANPYTTVLGSKRHGATRINIAQSCNGVGWLLGPFIGGLFFYGENPKLWVPYATVAVIVVLLAAVFTVAPMPDVKARDDYNLDADESGGASAGQTRKVKRGLSYLLLLGLITALCGVFGVIFKLILDTANAGEALLGFVSKLPRIPGIALTAETAQLITLFVAGAAVVLLAAIWLIPVVKRLTHQSIWAHEHFTGGILAQFCYMAAQASIFGFVINYMVAEPPSLPTKWLEADNKPWLLSWVDVEARTTLAPADFKNVPALAEKLHAAEDPVSAYLASKLSDSTKATLAQFRAHTAGEGNARVAIQQDLKPIVRPKEGATDHLYTPERFAGVALSEKTKELLAQDHEKRDEPRLNRLLLADAYPNELGFQDGIVSITDKTAANLVIALSACFLLGRVSGSWLLRRVSAHKLVGLYGVVNIFTSLLIILKVGWLSVASVFLNYFFMSIMFPTIFALGIFGLGKRAKGAAAYIVMAIAGGALLPKLMGLISEHYDVSRGFIVPMVAFIGVAIYGYTWPKLSRVESLHGVKAGIGH